MARSVTLETKLSAQRIHMTFTRDGKSTPVLNDVNLDVAKGEFLCIVGPSGCGKSTLLSAIGGFLTPNSGEIRIDDAAMTAELFLTLTVQGARQRALVGLGQTSEERRYRMKSAVLVFLEGCRPRNTAPSNTTD